MGDVEYGKTLDMYFPPSYPRLLNDPSCSILHMWRTLDRDMTDDSLVVGTLVKPKLKPQLQPFGEACFALWLGGNLIKTAEPHGHQVHCQMIQCIPEVGAAMQACINETDPEYMKCTASKCLDNLSVEPAAKAYARFHPNVSYQCDYAKHYYSKDPWDPE
eukprot:521645-Lingulodinium_polyedra.AAC.1